MLYTDIGEQILLVGGKNVVYKLNAQDLSLIQVLKWSPSEFEVELCVMKGKAESECQNYIKVLKQYKVRCID